MMQNYRGLPIRITGLFLLLFSLNVNSTIQAEDSGWPVVERCMSNLSYPIVPQSKWGFEGVIFSRNSEGVRAIRSDYETSYFVALDSDTSFAFEGTFSPDGKMFAYPLGTVQYGGLWADWITADAIQIVSTDPAKSESYKWEMTGWNWGRSGSGGRGISPIYWFDQESIIFQGWVQGLSGIHIMNTRTGDVEEPERAEEIYEESGRFAITSNWLHNGRDWLSDRSGYIGHHPLALYSNDNQLIEMIYPENSPYSISPDSNLILFRIDDRLVMADREEHIIYDLCFSVHQFNNPITFVFSPDSQYLAFLMDRYPVIVDLQTMTNTILDYQTDYLLAWFPTES